MIAQRNTWPEQMNGKPKAASDIYSLGVTCLHLLTGISPLELFDHGEFDWVWRDFCVDNPVADELGAVLDKMICQGTKKRYQSVGEVWQALGFAVQAQSPSAPPPSRQTIIQPAQPKVSRSGGFIERLPDGVMLEMVQLPAGSFMMGSPDSDGMAYHAEKPQHQVNVKAFAIGKYPVTQAQYVAVMGRNPSYFTGDPNCPVECVSWDDATKFCEKLSQLFGKQYRLPSEAEWEYACRAGTTTRYYFGDDANQLGDYAWYESNSGGVTHRVGQKKPNPWGLHDMHGGLLEWCLDHWHDSYNGAQTDGSAWITGGDSSYRVLRGGSWDDNPGDCRSALRFRFRPDVRDLDYGFRVVSFSAWTL